ncbi:hypothetical protein [Rhodococcus jostii]|uniref:VG15 protein n=1 Tax=Rhodococcus jostii TaxID=132919 RepID=UPI0036666134
MVSLSEQRAILTELHRLGAADLAALWRLAHNAGDGFEFLVEAFPELVAQYGVTAAELSALWYQEAAPHLAYAAVPAALPTLEQYAQSAKWALSAADSTTALDRLSGTLQRSVWGMARETTLLNADTEPGARWARHASANACEFCRMAATRGAVYTSKASATRVVGRGKDTATNFSADGTRRSGGQAKGIRVRGVQKVGDKYHDHCHCMAVPVRPGRAYQPPDYVEKWEQDYLAAVRATPAAGDHGAIDVKAVLSTMRRTAQ